MASNERDGILAMEGLIEYCRENGRVCPMPSQWNELWEMLPNRERVGSGLNPPPPLILAAWYEAPALVKMSRLEDHIKWAAERGALGPVTAFLRNLGEDQWHHLGE